MSQEQMARTQQAMASCRGGAATQIAESSARAQELAAMHEQRRAQRGGSDEATPPAGSGAQDYLRLLSNSDQQEINMATSIVHNKVRDECNGMDHMELHRQ